jgi:hypothetical protein
MEEPVVPVSQRLTIWACAENLQAGFNISPSRTKADGFKNHDQPRIALLSASPEAPAPNRMLWRALQSASGLQEFTP